MSEPPAYDTVTRVLRTASPSASILRWRLEPDPYPARTPSTEGLARVIAETVDGDRVTVFAKTIRSLRHWPMITVLPPPAREPLITSFPWRVEADAYAFGVFASLPDGLRAPVVYEIEDLGDDRIRIWMEDVAGPPVAWSPERYQLVARLLGRLAGRTLSSELAAGWPALFPGSRFLFDSRTAVIDIPAIRGEASWQHPLMVALAAADPRLRRDLLELADRGPAILDGLADLPQTLAHGDACPQNLLAEPRDADRFVAVDWGFVGLAPIGLDLGQLLVGRVESGELDVEELSALRDLIAEGYLTGLRDERASVEPRDILRGFIGGMLLRSAFTAIPLERLGGAPDEVTSAEFHRRARYARFLLDQRGAI